MKDYMTINTLEYRFTPRLNAVDIDMVLREAGYASSIHDGQLVYVKINVSPTDLAITLDAKTGTVGIMEVTPKTDPEKRAELIDDYTQMLADEGEAAANIREGEDNG
jgi:hypothetical protein